MFGEDRAASAACDPAEVPPMGKREDFGEREELGENCILEKRRARDGYEYDVRCVRH